MDNTYIVIGLHNRIWYSLNTSPIDEQTANFQAKFQSQLRHCETRVVKYVRDQYQRWPRQ